MASGNLSDDELRSELMRLGESDVPPVTNTTRKFLLNKLNNLLSTDCTQNNPKTRPQKARSGRNLRSSGIEPPLENGTSPSTVKVRSSSRRPVRSATKVSNSNNSNAIGRTSVPTRGLEASARSERHVTTSLAQLSLRTAPELSDSEGESSLYTVTNTSLQTSPGLDSPLSQGQTAGLRRRLNWSRRPVPFPVDDDNGAAGNRLLTHVSRGLVLAVVLFFLVLAFVYVSLRRQQEIIVTSSDEDLLTLTDCEEDDPLCRGRSRNAVALIQHVGDELNSRKVAVVCGGTTEQPTHMSRTALKNMADRLGFDSEAVTDCLELIWKNPHWSIQLLSTERDTDVRSPNDAGYLHLTSPSLPFSCRFRRALHSALFYVVAGLTSVFIVLAVWWGIRQHRARTKKHMREVYTMVESILDLVREQQAAHAENESLPDFVTISHARDKLIPLQKRDSMAGVWCQAVEYVNKQESRVRTEVQRIAGEEYDVWRWLNTLPGEGKRHVWQGAACSATTSMPIKAAPTPCLKVRNMFDAEVEVDSTWPEKVKDAVLEKIGPDHGVVHMAVDTQSTEGIVYVKCRDEESAGKAQQALNGWWFDSNLVSVKFVRLERYLYRFPESRELRRLLEPSSSSRSSMSARVYNSLLDDS